MTDAEIKKALEYYRGQVLFTSNRKKPEIYIHDIIDLINRQQAEIKKLQQGNVTLRDMVDTRQAEIERLQKMAIMVEAIEDSIYPLPFETDYDKAIKEAKAEAIKEFAERLKDNFPYKNACYTFEGIEYRIDNLLKEMVGDAE